MIRYLGGGGIRHLFLLTPSNSKNIWGGTCPRPLSALRSLDIGYSSIADGCRPCRSPLQIIWKPGFMVSACIGSMNTNLCNNIASHFMNIMGVIS